MNVLSDSGNELTVLFTILPTFNEYVLSAEYTFLRLIVNEFNLTILVVVQNRFKHSLNCILETISSKEIVDEIISMNII